MEHFVYTMKQGLPPTRMHHSLRVLMAHCSAASSLLVVLVRQRRVGLHQQHESQEAERKETLPKHEGKDTKGWKNDSLNSC